MGSSLSRIQVIIYDRDFPRFPRPGRGSILLGELVAIKMVISHIANTSHQRHENQIKKLHIFSDSQCAIGHLTLGWEAKIHKATIHETKKDIEKLRESGMEVEISWTPGHADIKGNDQADKMAGRQQRRPRKSQSLSYQLQSHCE